MNATTIARRSRATAGFTILEVMIVIGILSFGLLSLAAMQIQAMKGSDRGRHATNAAAIAENKMELLQQDAWASIGVTGGFIPDPVDPIETNIVQLDDGTSVERSYSVSYQVTDLQATFTRALDVQVSWTEQNGEARSITLSSIRYNREGT
ncbi:MAG: prepilin-type N-terminal cleavage/methylation domain-containing protein [Myxococcales bacterium]|nr:prepilin-type N-terminal cleavage/methylation domain-containing protein [Myxococcales bacterium]